MYANKTKSIVRTIKLVNSERKKFMIQLFIHVYCSFIGPVKHYALLFMIRDFDLEFSVFLKFNLFMKF